MKRLLITFLALAILIPALRLTDYAISHAQTAGVGIGTTTPDPSAIVDINLTNKGVLFPRMTTAQRDAIGVPAAGLLLYNTTTKVLQVYDGTTWKAAAMQ